MEDTYYTIKEKSEGYFKDKGSKFFSYAYPVSNEEQVKEILNEIKKSHHSARHHCYAWRLGTEEIQFRANDDGEPSSTAGKQILGQLLSHEITNALIVVVRYFGGTLLGVSGLINAYRNAAADAISNADVEQRIIEKELFLDFSYNELSEVMNIVKQENLTVLKTRFEEDCSLSCLVRKSEFEKVTALFQKNYKIKIRNKG
jgi:uncharacterized YigZ family protein